MKSIANLLLCGLAAVSLGQTPFDPAAIDRNIALHEARVKRDPKGAIGWSMLAEAWLARAREFDSDRAGWQAQRCAERSLQIRERGNHRAYMTYIESLLEQHRFADAVASLEKIGNRTRIYADALIEVGRYDDAAKVLSALPADDLGRQTSSARLLSARGRHAQAISTYRSVLQELSGNAGVAQTTLAWYHTKLGVEFYELGRWDESHKAFAQAVSFHPRNYKAHLGLAKVAKARGQWTKCMASAQKCIDISGLLEAKSLMAEANAALGRRAQAEKWYADILESYQGEVELFDRLEKGGKHRVRPVDRQFATFAAKHRMFVREGLEAARRDYANRPDAHARENLARLTTLAARVRKDATRS
jgi:tetratricopeptide (TPR) repeat protein